MRTITFQLNLLQEGPTARGTFMPITPLISCPCGGQYGTWELAGTIAGTLTMSGSAGIPASGVGNAMTFRLRASTGVDTLSGTVTGNLTFVDPTPVRGTFSGTISARRP